MNSTFVAGLLIRGQRRQSRPLTLKPREIILALSRRSSLVKGGAQKTPPTDPGSQEGVCPILSPPHTRAAGRNSALNFFGRLNVWEYMVSMVRPKFYRVRGTAEAAERDRLVREVEKYEAEPYWIGVPTYSPSGKVAEDEVSEDSPFQKALAYQKSIDPVDEPREPIRGLPLTYFREGLEDPVTGPAAREGMANFSSSGEGVGLREFLDRCAKCTHHSSGVTEDWCSWLVKRMSLQWRDTSGGPCGYFEASEETPMKRKEEKPADPVPVELGSDGKCKCSVASPCQLGKTGSEPRCTKAELEGRGIPTFQKPQGQPMEKPDIIRCDCNPGSKVCPWIRDMETPRGEAVWLHCGRHKAVTTVKPNMAKWQGPPAGFFIDETSDDPPESLATFLKVIEQMEREAKKPYQAPMVSKGDVTMVQTPPPEEHWLYGVSGGA